MNWPWQRRVSESCQHEYGEWKLVQQGELHLYPSLADRELRGVTQPWLAGFWMLQERQCALCGHRQREISDTRKTES